MWGVCNTPLPYRQEIFLSCLPSIFSRNPSFSCLDTGKRMRKENQGIRDAGQFGRVPDFFVVHLSFSVVSGRAQKHTPHKRPGRGGFKTVGRAKFLPFGAYNMDGGGVAPWPLHPFLVLIQEKDAKRKSRPHRGRGIWPGT